MPAADTLLTLFGAEDDLDLGALQALSEQDPEQPLSDADIEALMRAQWGLSALDVSGAMRAAEAGRVSVRPDDSDQDDYSEEEWVIVQAMRKLCLDAIAPGSSPRRRAHCVEWLFVRGTEDRHGISFHLACEMLRARHWVIQALIQHFWFLRSIVPVPLPFMADMLPESLQSEAILHGWGAGMRIATAAWVRPGILLPTLRTLVMADMLPESLQDVSETEFDHSMQTLTEAGVIGLRTGQVYVTSRPASFRRARQVVSWSNTLLGD